MLCIGIPVAYFYSSIHWIRIKSIFQRRETEDCHDKITYNISIIRTIFFIDNGNC